MNTYDIYNTAFVYTWQFSGVSQPLREAPLFVYICNVTNTKTIKTWYIRDPTEAFRINSKRASVAVADRLLSDGESSADEWISLLVKALHKRHYIHPCHLS